MLIYLRSDLRFSLMSFAMMWSCLLKSATYLLPFEQLGSEPEAQ